MATVTKDTSIIEVLQLDPGTARILIGYGMHCLGCPHATAESIADACAAHGSDPRAPCGKAERIFITEG